VGTAVGLTPRNGGVLAVRLRASGSRARLKAAVQLQCNGSKPAVRELLQEEKFPAKRLALALPADLIKVRKTRLPLRSPSQIRKTIGFHAERILPDVSIDEILLDYFVTERGQDYTELLLLVVKRSDLAAFLDRLGLASEPPDTLTVDFVALFNLLAATGMYRGAASVAVVFFSPQCTTFLLVREGKLAAVRNFPTCGATPLSERLKRELRYFFTVEGLASAPQRLVLCGCRAELSIQEAFEGTEVIEFDPARKLRAGKDTPPEALVAAGAALEALGKAELSLALREQGPAARHAPYQVIRTPLFLSAVAALALLGAELLQTMQQRSAAGVYLARMNREAQYWFRRVVRGPKPKFSSSFNKTIEALAKQRSAKGGADGGWESFLDFLAVLCEHLPADYGVIIQSVNFRGNKATIRGEAADVDRFEALARSLEQSGEFRVRTPFRMRSGRRSLPARVAFTIELSPRS